MADTGTSRPKEEETGIAYFTYSNDEEGFCFRGILSFALRDEGYIPYIQRSPWSTRIYLDDCLAQEIEKAFHMACMGLGDKRQMVMGNPRNSFTLSAFRIEMWNRFFLAKLCDSEFQRFIKALGKESEVLSCQAEQRFVKALGKESEVLSNQAEQGIAALYSLWAENSHHDVVEPYVSSWERGYMTWLKFAIDDLPPVRWGHVGTEKEEAE